MNRTIRGKSRSLKNEIDRKENIKNQTNKWKKRETNKRKKHETDDKMKKMKQIKDDEEVIEYWGNEIMKNDERWWQLKKR